MAQPMLGNHSSASHMQHHASPFCLLKGLFSGSCALVQRKHDSGPSLPEHGLRHKQKKKKKKNLRSGQLWEGESQGWRLHLHNKDEHVYLGRGLSSGLQKLLLALPAITCVAWICCSISLSFRFLLHSRCGYGEFPQHPRPFCAYVRTSAPSVRCHRPSCS